MVNDAPDIPGAERVVAWYGSWPTFHDAEVISIALHRSEPSRVVVLIPNRALVTFVMEGFYVASDGNTNTSISYFNHQNVLSGLHIHRWENGYDLALDGIFGVDATLCSARLSVELEPLPPAIA